MGCGVCRHYAAPCLVCREVLFKHFESPEEGTRNVVAECVGKLTLVEPDILLPNLRENLKSQSGFVRSTVVTALKYTISDQPQPIDSLLHDCIGEFLSTIGDPDLVSTATLAVAFVFPVSEGEGTS